MEAPGWNTGGIRVDGLEMRACVRTLEDQWWSGNAQRGFSEGRALVGEELLGGRAVVV